MRDIAADRSERSVFGRVPEKIPLSGQKFDKCTELACSAPSLKGAASSAGRDSLRKADRVERAFKLSRTKEFRALEAASSHVQTGGIMRRNTRFQRRRRNGRGHEPPGFIERPNSLQRGTD